MSKFEFHSEWLHKCLDCGSRCCRYITIKIPTPKTIYDFDGLLWQVAHKNVEAYKDSTGWYLMVNSDCVHLGSRGECTIYDTRPITCRQYKADGCEYDQDGEDCYDEYFADYESLEKYCRKRFKSWKKRFKGEED